MNLLVFWVRPGLHTCEYIIAPETVSVFVPLLSALRLLRAGPTTTSTGLCSLVVTAVLAATALAAVGQSYSRHREVPLQVVGLGITVGVRPGDTPTLRHQCQPTLGPTLRHQCQASVKPSRQSGPPRTVSVNKKALWMLIHTHQRQHSQQLPVRPAEAWRHQSEPSSPPIPPRPYIPTPHTCSARAGSSEDACAAWGRLHAAPLPNPSFVFARMIAAAAPRRRIPVPTPMLNGTYQTAQRSPPLPSRQCR